MRTKCYRIYPLAASLALTTAPSASLKKYHAHHESFARSPLLYACFFAGSAQRCWSRCRLSFRCPPTRVGQDALRLTPEQRRDLWERMTPEQRQQWRNARSPEERRGTLQSFSPEQRRETWQQLSPEQRQNLRGQMTPDEREAMRKRFQERQQSGRPPNGAERPPRASFLRKSGSGCASRSNRRGAMSTGAVTAATEGKRNDALAGRHVAAWLLALSSVAAPRQLSRKSDSGCASRSIRRGAMFTGAATGQQGQNK